MDAAKAPEKPLPLVEPDPIPRFRVWHKVLGRMFSLKAIFFEGSDGPLAAVELVDIGGRYDFDDVILMTRANFATKSGTLFDGDIIRDDRYSPLYRIAFRQDFGWDCFEVGGTPDDTGFILAEDGPHIEVVGNIYQNPELLA